MSEVGKIVALCLIGIVLILLLQKVTRRLPFSWRCPYAVECFCTVSAE